MIRRIRLISLLGCLGWVFCISPAALATPSQMENLPTAREGCLICHSGVDVTASSAGSAPSTNLNDFANDWISNGRIWDEILASMNSDGDGCPNGFELGDSTGRWRPGQQRPQGPADRNPGEGSDCPLPVDAQTWGTLKDFFGNN